MHNPCVVYWYIDRDFEAILQTCAWLLRRKMHRRRSTSASPEPKDKAAAGEPGDAAAASAGGTPQPSPRGERSEAEEGDEALALTPEETLRDAEDGDVVSPPVSPRGERRSRSGPRSSWEGSNEKAAPRSG